MKRDAITHFTRIPQSVCVPWDSPFGDLTLVSRPAPALLGTIIGSVAGRAIARRLRRIMKRGGCGPLRHGVENRGLITMHANGRAIALLMALFVATMVIEDMRPTKAMPPFAQAYGMHCEVCHSIVPALNAFGRSVQRSGYATLDASTIHRADPLWIGVSPFYDTHNPAQPHQVQLGNLALHAVGFIGKDLTFHAQQWIWQADQPGGTDTLWLSYNNILHREGHLFVGKIEPPAPSPFSQWFDLAGFAAPSITVGEHAYQFSNNAWGTKLVYVHRWFTAEAGYLGPSGNLNTATDFATADTDKRFQWRVLDSVGPKRMPESMNDMPMPKSMGAKPMLGSEGYKPLEVGLYGGSGVFQASDGLLDRYHAEAAYAEMDPQAGLPGAFVVYQRGYDSHPGAGLAATASQGFSAELYEPVAQDHAMLALRYEYSDAGLGASLHQGNVDLAVLVSHHVSAPVVNAWIVNLEATLMERATPGWRGQLWYVTTIGPLRH